MPDSKTAMRHYRGMDCVFIKNPKQAYKYMKHGAILYDLLIGEEEFIFAFNKKEVTPLYDLWCKRELD